jgi:hypothetical protein
LHPSADPRQLIQDMNEIDGKIAELERRREHVGDEMYG